MRVVTNDADNHNIMRAMLKILPTCIQSNLLMIIQNNTAHRYMALVLLTVAILIAIIEIITIVALVIIS